MKELFRHKPIFQELAEVRTKISRAEDEKAKKEFEAYEDQIREFSVFILQRVKDREDGAFEDLMNLKDMRNFLHFYTYHIREYHKFRYTKQNVIHEVRYQIFYHVVNNYRIYNEPHEISLLIMSMRNWIRQKVSNALKNTYNPKNDEILDQVFLEASDFDDTEIIVRDLVNRYLNDDERMVFELKFFQGRGYVDIGQQIGTSKDTAQRRYKSALEKLKRVINKEL